MKRANADLARVIRSSDRETRWARALPERYRREVVRTPSLGRLRVAFGRSGLERGRGSEDDGGVPSRREIEK